MSADDEYSGEVRIGNPLGFHVRPVQRFAEFARLFRSDVEVEIRGRKAPARSIINLMSLGGRLGDTITICARGEDARQCANVLRYIAENDFFVEDMLEDPDPERHVARLAHMAGCFDSDVTVSIDGKSADAKDLDELRVLGIEPSSSPTLDVQGADAEQARAVLTHMIDRSFFVEDEMAKKSQAM